MKSLKIVQEIGNRFREVAIWNNLANIDRDQGKYKEAQEKYMKSLKIAQETGNKVGEAANWKGLGYLAKEQGSEAKGIKLVALCYLIDQSGYRISSRVAVKAWGKVAFMLLTAVGISCSYAFEADEAPHLVISRRGR